MISHAKGSFGKHLKNRQIPYQSVRGPPWHTVSRYNKSQRLTGTTLVHVDIIYIATCHVLKLFSYLLQWASKVG